MNPVLYKLYYFTYKNLYWVLLLGFFLMLFGYMSNVIANQNLQLEYSQAVYNSQQDEITGVKNVLSEKINELGQQETKIKAIVGEKQTLKMMLDKQNSAFAKQLEQLKIDLKDLRSVTNLKVTTSGQFVTITKDSIIERIVERWVGDTLKKETIVEKLQMIDYKEPSGWFTMTGSIQGDTVKFQPIFYEEYDIAIHEERKAKKYFFDLFPGKHTVGTVFTKNPYTRTNSVKVIVQEKEKRKLFGIF